MGSLTIALAMPLPPLLKAGAALAVLASLAYGGWHHFLRRSHHAVVGLKILREGMKVETRSGSWTTANILATSFVSPWLTVLNLKLPQQRLPTHVVLLPDMLSRDEFRRLRVWLKWGNPHMRGKEDGGML